jgi:hypothetical protein
MSFGGDSAKFHYVPEVAFGIIPANPAMLGIETIPTIEPSIDPNNILRRGCGSRDLTAIKAGVRKVALKLGFDVPASDPGNFIGYALSLNPFTGEVTYDKNGTIVDLRHVGALQDKLKVSCSVDDVIKAEVDIIAQDLQTASAKITGATYTEATGSIPFSDSYVWKGDADGTGLAEVLTVTDWEFTVANNLKRVPVIRSDKGYLAKYIQGCQRDLTGKLIMDFESKAQYDEVIADAEFSLKLGLGPDKAAVFTHCKWDSVSTPTKAEDLVSVTLPFTARPVSFQDV